MKYQWIGKKVDLQVLVKKVELFLRARKFKTKLDDSSDLKVISGVLREKDQVRNVVVKISGNPDDFVVDFSARGHFPSIIKISSLLSLLGGGVFVLKSQMEVEFYQKLEREFWNYLDEVVPSSSNSAGSSPSHSKLRI